MSRARPSLPAERVLPSPSSCSCGDRAGGGARRRPGGVAGRSPTRAARRGGGRRGERHRRGIGHRRRRRRPTTPARSRSRSTPRRATPRYPGHGADGHARARRGGLHDDHDGDRLGDGGDRGAAARRRDVVLDRVIESRVCAATATPGAADEAAPRPADAARRRTGPALAPRRRTGLARDRRRARLPELGPAPPGEAPRSVADGRHVRPGGLLVDPDRHHVEDEEHPQPVGEAPAEQLGVARAGRGTRASRSRARRRSSAHRSSLVSATECEK